jgi:hypothetical protein
MAQFLLELVEIGSYNFLSLLLPLSTICLSIVQIFIARNPEDTALLQLVRQRNNIVVKEPKLALVPAICRVFVGTSVAIVDFST